MLRHYLVAWAIFCALLLAGSSANAAPVDDTKLQSANQDTGNWLMYGRTYDDHRFSPLDQINEESVAKLGLAWSRELGSTRGLEATPLVKDGIIYATGNWSVVYAIDAKSGDIRWTYDPKVPRARRVVHLLRRRESRRGSLSRQGVCRHARWPSHRA